MAGAKSVSTTSKRLVNLTNAYLAIEDLLKSRFVSDETRRRLEESMRMLDEEASRLMKEHSESTDPDEQSSEEVA